jgi:hypothetical protein
MSPTRIAVKWSVDMLEQSSRLLLVSVLSIALFGCGSRDQKATDKPTIQSVAAESATEHRAPRFEIALGDAEGVPVLSGRLAFARSGDRIFVGDCQADRVHAVDATGVWHTIAEPGAGPGEISGLVALAASDSQLFVAQSRPPRVSCFDLTTNAHLYDLSTADMTDGRRTFVLRMTLNRETLLVQLLDDTFTDTEAISRIHLVEFDVTRRLVRPGAILEETYALPPASVAEFDVSARAALAAPLPGERIVLGDSWNEPVLRTLHHDTQQGTLRIAEVSAAPRSEEELACIEKRFLDLAGRMGVQAVDVQPTHRVWHALSAVGAIVYALPFSGDEREGITTVYRADVMRGTSEPLRLVTGYRRGRDTMSLVGGDLFLIVGGLSSSSCVYDGSDAEAGDTRVLRVFELAEGE